MSSAPRNRKILYVSPMHLPGNNGMMQRQLQILTALCQHGATTGQQVEILSLGARPSRMRKWLSDHSLSAEVAASPLCLLAYYLTSIWYVAGVLFCNKLRLIRNFRFPWRLPLPARFLNGYALIWCYYPWAHRLLRLEEVKAEVIVDLGDVMSNRHSRIGSRRWISLRPEDEALVVNNSRCIAISDGDASEFHRLYDKRLSIIPFVHSKWEGLVVNSAASRKHVGFIGAPSLLNERIIELLASTEFLARIHASGVRLTIAGGICNRLSIRLLDTFAASNVRLLGEIHDIGQFYSQASIILNPVGPSTGMKIKSVEALLARKILVTTKWGVDAILQQFFDRQIRLIGWPVSAEELARAVLAAIDAESKPAPMAAAAYASAVRKEITALLSQSSP